MTNLPQKSPPCKELDDDIIEGLHALSNDLHEVLEAHHAGPNSALAVAVLARLLAQTIKARPEHISRMERWRGMLKLVAAAEWLLHTGYQPSWLDSEFEAQHYFASGEVGETGLDDFLVELLHEGAGKARTSRIGLGGGLECQS